LEYFLFPKSIKIVRYRLYLLSSLAEQANLPIQQGFCGKARVLAVLIARVMIGSQALYWYFWRKEKTGDKERIHGE